jgi:hypothetical protein
MRGLSAAFLLALGLSTATVLSAEDASPWVVPPKLGREIPAADVAARKELLALIERKQDDKFRKRYRLIVPEQATGLSGNYEIAIYSISGTSYAASKKVIVASERAIAEQVTREGVRRGELPREEVDRLARLVVLAYATRKERRASDRGSNLIFNSHHVPDSTFEVVGRSADLPFHFRTKAEPWYVQNIAHDADNALTEFILSRVNDRMWTLCSELLKPLSDEEERAFVLKQLQGLPAGKFEGNGRRDVDRILYSQLAVKHRLADALPEFKRLEFDEPLKQLEVVTAADPLPLLGQMLAADRETRWTDLQWAKCYILSSDDPKLRSLLWPKVFSLFELDYDRLANDLLSIKLTPEELKVFERHFDEAQKPADKIFIAEVLLNQIKANRYFDYLFDQAKDLRSDDQKTAAHAIFAFAGENRLKLKEARLLLAAAWEEADDKETERLLPVFGWIGTREDLPKLTPYLHHESAYTVSLAIEAMADIDPAVAIEAAHGRVQKYLEGSELSGRLYSWNVSEYFNLYFWQRDQACLPLIERAGATIDPDEMEWGGWKQSQKLLTQYLKATTLDDRVKAALAFEPYLYKRHWKKDIGRQLLAEGAHAKQLEPLLNPPRRRYFEYPYP